MRQTQENEEPLANGWQLLYNVMRELHAGLVRDISCNCEIRRYAQHDHSDGDWLYALSLDAYSAQLKMLGMVKDTMTMAQAALQTDIELTDRVAVNALCRELASATDAHTFFSTDLPDFYEVKTNKAMLTSIISRLLLTAGRYVEEQYRGRGADKGLCLVAKKGSKRGSIVFSVSNKALPLAIGKAQTAFMLPQETAADDVARRIELCMLRQQVRLLGGDMFIDPEYCDGMRVMFYIGFCSQV